MLVLTIQLMDYLLRDAFPDPFSLHDQDHHYAISKIVFILSLSRNTWKSLARGITLLVRVHLFIGLVRIRFTFVFPGLDLTRMRL